MNGESDKELMELVVQEHRPAFEKLYDRYIKLIYSYALKAVKGDKEKAKEIVQQVFLRIWITKRDFDPSKGKLINWLITITRNISIDYIRKEKRLNEKKDKVRESKEMFSDTPSIENNSLIRMQMKEAKSQLSEEQKRLINRLYWEGYTLSEIAKMEGQPLGTVKSRLYQSLKRLRYYLGVEEWRDDR